MIQEKKKGARPVRHIEKQREWLTEENARTKRPTAKKQNKPQAPTLVKEEQKANDAPKKRRLQKPSIQQKKVKKQQAPIVEEKKPTLPSSFKKKGAGRGATLKEAPEKTADSVLVQPEKKGKAKSKGKRGSVRVMALGGLHEIGKNMTVF